MPEPTDPHATAPPRDPSASSLSEPDETAPHAAGNPKFGPPAAAGEVGTLGPYRVLKRVGKGGMGAVYLAIDTRLGRKLALKVMLPEFAANAEAKERFLREARAAAQITHDNVVTVYEADERDGVPYITMQFLQGYPLDDFLKNKGVPPLVHTVRIAAEAAAGLAAAHDIGLVHRDIKPANLWLEAPNGRVKVLDFGLAKPLASESELTRSGAVIGTPAFMSPEQARGVRVDHRTDLWSLGCVLYKLCTGHNPFTGPSVIAVLTALAVDEPTPVRELNPQVPEPLADLVHQLLAKRSEHRPQTAAEVEGRLRDIHAALLTPGGSGLYSSASRPAVAAVPVPLSVTAVPESAFANLDDEDATETEPAERSRAANARGVSIPLVAAAVVAVAVAIVVGVVLAMSGGKKSPPTEPQAARPEPGPAKPPKPVGEPAPPGERRYTAAELLAEQVVLPEPDPRQLIHTDTFAEPFQASGGIISERGRLSVSTNGTLWWYFGRSPTDNFAVEIVTRTVGAPAERGGLVLRGKQVGDLWHAYQLLFNPAGELTVEPWVYANDEFKAANPALHTFRSKSARADNSNTLTAIVRGKYLEVYVNRAAVCNPLDLPLSVNDLILQGLGRDPNGRAQFTSVRIWSVAGTPTPFQAK